MAILNCEKKDVPLRGEMKERKFQETEISCRWFRSSAELPDIWDSALPEAPIYLSLSYLRALESAPPTGMRLIYFGLFQDGVLVAKALGQLVDLDLEKNWQPEENIGKPKTFFESIGRSFAKRFSFRALTIGNLLTTGEHGCYCDPEKIDKESFQKSLVESLDACRKDFEGTDNSFEVTMIKELFNSKRIQVEQPWCKALHEFQIEPNLIMKMRWESFDDYLAAMSSKYRVRAKRAFKKGKEIVKSEMSLEDLVSEKPEMYRLYKEVTESAGFNTVDLHPNYFVELKRNLKEDFQVFKYMVGEKCIGFYTAVRNGKILDAHYLGLDKAENISRQAYLNMLYDLIRLAIEWKSEWLNYGRTASEIKTSVGAVPEEMFVYVKTKGAIKNKIMVNILDYVNRKEEWVQRKPFKA